jgi:hypothetical protein
MAPQIDDQVMPAIAGRKVTAVTPIAALCFCDQSIGRQ